MSVFKVTHIDAALRKRQRRVPAPNAATAQAWLRQLYGEALAMSAVRVVEDSPCTR